MRRLSGDEGKEVTYSRVKKAKKTKALERSLGVSVSEQVYEELEKEMNQIDR